MSYPIADLLTLEDLDVSQAEECPICMESFSSCNNKTMTECGHCFHTSCLMKNAAHNGFGCPYCRKVLADKPEEDEDDEDEWSIYDDEDEPYSDFALRGTRWLFQRVNNEEVDEEEDRNDQMEEEDDLEEEAFEPPPPFEYVLNKMQTSGITYEDLVKYMLLDENFGITDRNVVKVEADLIAGYNKVYTKIRQISATYQPLPVVE